MHVLYYAYAHSQLIIIDNEYTIYKTFIIINPSEHLGMLICYKHTHIYIYIYSQYVILISLTNIDK